jgi:hypothetical protein
MRYQWQQLLERFCRSRGGTSKDHGRRVAFLHIGIIVVIVLVGGPEVIAAMELITLLEILGATLFLTAYAAGLKLLWLALVRTIRKTFLPLAPLFLERSAAPRLEKLRAVVYVTASTAWWLAFAIGA